MKSLGLVMGLLCLFVFLRASHAFEFGRDVTRDSLDLNGTWEVFRGDGTEEPWKTGAAADVKWDTTEVPGPLLRGLKNPEQQRVRFVWARRSFTLDETHAARDVVLRWNGIRFGATAWINGTPVCEHTAIGPNTVFLKRGIVKAGKNELVLKVPGWSGVIKNRAGYPLMPTGGSTQSWGAKNAAIFYDIWLEFYDDAYLKWVLAMPDVRKGVVTFRVWVEGVGKLPDAVELDVTVRPWQQKVVKGRAKATIRGGKSPVDVPLTIEDVKLWSLEERTLYEATLTAKVNGKLLDEVTVRFGMRELTVKNGHYTLNGKRFRFRGSNLVNEWHWGQPPEESIFNKNIKRYIVDEARTMSLNSFRTHTCPPPHLWLNVADEEGTLFLAEFPVLYNYGNFRFTKEDLEVWHRNALTDATGWVTMLWNHPSVAIWVLSNESRGDDKWEAGPFRDHVVALDPTRTTLRTGVPSGTTANVDIHTCGNYSRDAEGKWLLDFERAAKAKDPKRTLTNTEYMNSFGDESLRNCGQSKHPDAALDKAVCAMEHTEAMRRLDYDGVWPYMYAGWTGLRTGRQWRKEFPTPMAAALHSCMSPVLASLDLYDRNFVPGSEMSTRVVLINDTDDEVTAKLDVCVTPADPLCVPDEDALKAAVWKQTFPVTMKTQSHSDMTVKWSLPDKPGRYYLAAVVRQPGKRPVVSQREVRSVAQEPLDGRLKGRKVAVLGGPQWFEKWLERRGASSVALTEGKVSADVVVAWDPAKVSDDDRKRLTPVLLDFVHAGGRLVVLDPQRWFWEELVDFQTRGADASRAFAYPDVKHFMLAGVERELLCRWNGVPNAISRKRIHGTLLDKGKKLLWAGDPKDTVAMSLPTGKGEIIVSLLQVKGRIERSSKDYDPVAERIVTNLLAE